MTLVIAGLLAAAASGAFLGYCIGLTQGDDEGYRRGYHEGGFDALYAPDTHANNCENWRGM